jgi:hypothetical protein
MLWKKLSSNLGNVIPAGDPYYANVVLLLHGDGANGGGTNGLADRQHHYEVALQYLKV